jgi:hypothetical protein
LTRISARHPARADDDVDGRRVGAAGGESAMEFHIAMGEAPPQLFVIDDAVRAIDPAALVDIDGATLRVATSLGAAELTSVINAAGYPIAMNQVTQVASICCGGCSG